MWVILRISVHTQERNLAIEPYPRDVLQGPCYLWEPGKENRRETEQIRKAQPRSKQHTLQLPLLALHLHVSQKQWWNGFSLLLTEEVCSLHRVDGDIHGKTTPKTLFTHIEMLWCKRQARHDASSFGHHCTCRRTRCTLLSCSHTFRSVVR